MKHHHYKDCLFNNEIRHCQLNQFRSYNHQVYTKCSVSVNKIGLSPFDDKRYVLDNGIDALAHGHYKAV